eukprot:TRINITY_DN81669_c0_g1_i2.p2 TRINITY_DN81669_c0_g1~~TRINITY_DN81669_c0_g1_i2.p2  ORF type:complete len:241 (-),score=60.75 TRINITY_DN81669_c0_g1_i2:68-790(-)
MFNFMVMAMQQTILIEDEKKTRIFHDQKISSEVSADALGDQYKGYIFKIKGGSDKEGFPMKQGVLKNGRVKLLLDAGSVGNHPPRAGTRQKKSVRGCIVGPDISVLDLVVVQKGAAELKGITDRSIPCRLGPKRAAHIRKLFNLKKDADVRGFVVRRSVPRPKEGKKPRSKAPKIQRLITPVTLQRKRRLRNLKIKRREKSKREAAEYAKLLARKKAEKTARASRKSKVSKKSAGPAKAT